MIASFGNQLAAHLFQEKASRAARELPRDLWRIAQRKLKALDVAVRVEDLLAPPGNRLERLKGKYAGRYSIHINDQYRITFRWEASQAHEVRVEDYH